MCVGSDFSTGKTDLSKCIMVGAESNLLNMVAIRASMNLLSH